MLGNRQRGERVIIKGNWKCSQCGAEITELPFEPDARPLFCRECHRNRINGVNKVKTNESI